METEYRIINPYDVDMSIPNQAYNTVIDKVEMLSPTHMVITLRVLPVEETNATP